MEGFFKDLLVLEFASVLAGPSVGMFFAELGARVLKIENPDSDGDVTRNWLLPGEKGEEGVSAYFSSVNWGKESIFLDLRTEEGREAALRLVEKADVAIMSFKPGDAEKLGLDYATLEKRNPTLICAEISAYGEEDDRVGFDAIIQAESGFTYMNGSADGPPVKMPVALVDVLAAHQLKEGVLLALLRRERSGTGSRIQVSLLQAAVSALVNQASNYLVAGFVPQRMGSDHPNIVPYGTVFTTADSKALVLAVGNDRQFAGLCDTLGHPEWARDARFIHNPLRVRNKADLLPLLEKAIGTFKREELLEKLLKRKVPVGAIRDMQEVFEASVAQAQTLQRADIQGLRGVAWIDSEEVRKTELQAPQTAGRHTAKVLQELLGLSPEEIAKVSGKGDKS